MSPRAPRALDAAMARVPDAGARRRRRLGLALVVLLGILAADGYGLTRETLLNRAVARGHLAGLAREDSPRGALARAYMLQSQGHLEQALAAYGEVPADAPADVIAVQRYNLANLYLERAVVLERSDEAQLAMSLVELAKESYRNVLARDPRQWDARFNLSRALQMLPDVPAVEFEDERNPERSPRAPQAAPAVDRLP